MAASKPKINRTGDTSRVSGYDVCQTPPYAVDALIPFIRDYITLEHKQNITIWESASGPEKLIVQRLQEHNFDVFGSDLADDPRDNFFEINPQPWDIQVTNPPWSIKYDWIRRSCELGKPFALLVPYETTFAARFWKIFEQYHNKPHNFVVLSPRKRINFKMPDKGWGKLEWDEKKQKMIMRGDSAQMPTMWLTYGLVLTVSSPNLITKPIDIKPVKYNEDNTVKI